MTRFLSLVLLVLASSFSSFVLGGSIAYEDCIESPSNGFILDVSMEGCSSTGFNDPCLISPGETAVGAVIFESAGDANSLECKIFGIIEGLEVPFPGGCPNTDACEDLDGAQGAICPIREGDLFIYLLAMEILEEYPQVDVVGKWTLRDHNDDILLCFKVPIRIVGKKTDD